MEHNYVWRVLDLFRSYGDAEAVVTGDRRLTYTDLADNVLSLATVLREHGFRSGQTVGILAGNAVETVYLQLGLHLLGCRTAWVGAVSPRPYQIEYLRRAGVDAFVYQVDERAPVAAELVEAVRPPQVFCLGPGGLGADLLAARPAGPAPDPAEDTDEPQSFFQTTGTTGLSKLVHHRQSFYTALLAHAQRWLAEGRPVLRHLVISGFWHGSGQLAELMVLFTGGSVLLKNGFDPGDVLATIERERVTSTFISPAGLYELLNHPRLAQTDHSSLIMLNCGGSAASPARLAEAIDRFGPVLRIGYGLTEAPLITEFVGLDHDPDHPERLASCGRPYFDMRVEVRDPDGQVLPPGQVGEVWASGSLLMAGYWNEPELNRERLVDGWLRTGDLGRFDQDGYLYLVGRTADVIITGTGAIKVFAQAVEDVLTSHPQVRTAAVVGVPDPAMGEAVVAYVVPVADATVTGDELRELVSAKLRDVWAPKEVVFAPTLPLIGLGKVDKNALRERYLQARGTGQQPRDPDAAQVR